MFVDNSVKELKESHDILFKYINTKKHSIGLPKRGVSSKELKECKLWWQGPLWLVKNQSSWSTWNMPEIDLEKIKENAEQSTVV